MIPQMLAAMLNLKISGQMISAKFVPMFSSSGFPIFGSVESEDPSGNSFDNCANLS